MAMKISSSPRMRGGGMGVRKPPMMGGASPSLPVGARKPNPIERGPKKMSDAMKKKMGMKGPIKAY